MPKKPPPFRLSKADRKARQAAQRAQGEVWHENSLFHASIAAKLRGKLNTPQFVNFDRCGREEIYRRCQNCKTTERLEWRCNLKWCPRCQWRLAGARRDFIREYASTLKQPKHLVLTSRNFPKMTSQKLKDNSLAMTALRDRTSFSAVTGGCASVECTWSEKGKWINGVKVAGGFHLHSHWLIEARWINMAELEEDWCDLIGQDISINRVFDARKKDYLRELTKYVVEGSELASWPAHIIRQFVVACRGNRFFFPFGELFKRGQEFRRAVNLKKPPSPACDCGCDRFGFEIRAEPETRGEQEKQARRDWQAGMDEKQLPENIFRAKCASNRMIKQVKDLTAKHTRGILIPE